MYTDKHPDNPKEKFMENYSLKRQRLVYKDGHGSWEGFEEKAGYEASETALVIVDMWDRHWSTGATRRGAVLADKINALAIRARKKGILVVHAPSDTMDFYQNDEARKRFLSLEAPPSIPEPVTLEGRPQPVDASDGGSDTGPIDQFKPNTGVWKRQTEKIFIDQGRDLICGDEGDRLCAHLFSRGIKFILYAGVHTNMCVIGRSFGIFKMLRRGFKTALIRDLTDAMYNPAMPPYVSHDEGTGMIVGYIEKFYSPTVDSGQI
jgi:nicotinamidase-related amidase